MELHKAYRRARIRRFSGFTLIEVAVTIAILLVIISFGAVVSMDSFRGYLFQSERTLIVSALTRARGLSLNNVSGVPHGLCYDSVAHQYVIFQGRNCILGAASNETINANQNITVTGLSSSIIFSQLAATTSPATIHLSDGTYTSEIMINYEGTITW